MDAVYLDIHSPEMNQRVPLHNTPVTIGRHTDNTVVLTDVQASRFHCVIARAEKGIVVRDLDSRNGTRVNGELQQSAKLNSGDSITIGATVIQLVVLPKQVKAPSNKRLAPKKGTVILPPPPRPGATDKIDPPPAVADKPIGKRPRLVATPAPDDIGKAADDEELIELEEVNEADEADLLAGVAIASKDTTVEFGVSSTAADDERFLPVLAESLLDKTFGVEDISLVNQRGQVMHPAAAKEGHGKDSSSTNSTGDAVGVLRLILLISCRTRATDVHIEPKNEDYQLRLRIDGNMVDIVRLGKNLAVKLCSLVKVLSDIDLQYRSIIQEGHFTSIVPSRRIDYRVSFAPAVQGQKLVIRILDTANGPLHLGDLQMPAWMTEEIRRANTGDSGMILVVGPTGSGKTTTLYSALRDVGTGHRNVVTIEDPVEIELPGVTQIPVDESHGNTFSNLLRSMLRQDPDVIMVGEIRDAETAAIAMQAAMTGHLVLSTLHARDTAGTVVRLLDLGVERYLIASSLQIVIAQRLVRLLCPLCKKAAPPTAEQLQRLGKRGRTIEKAYVPVGCSSCLKTGYAGRRAIFEMLTATEELREAILKNPSPKEIQRAQTGTMFASLLETGYQLVTQGFTALDEIEKVVGRT